MKVDKSKCIGCGACVGVCPDVFDFGDDGLACVKSSLSENEIKDSSISEDVKKSVKEAMEYCPVGAITDKE